MIVLIILLIIALVLGVLFLYTADDDYISSFILKPAAIIMILYAGATIYKIVDSTSCNKTPKAIDVYRGRTTLQITYQDSIPIDSIVVFKDK